MNTETDFSFLFDLERKLLDPAVRNNAKEVDSLLGPDFFEFGCSGKVWQRYQTIEALAKETIEKVASSDFKAQYLSENIVLVTYRTKRKDSPSVLRSSIWKKNGNQWQMAFHQGTKTSNV